MRSRNKYEGGVAGVRFQAKGRRQKKLKSQRFMREFWKRVQELMRLLYAEPPSS
jgi:hypothetical protein